MTRFEPLACLFALGCGAEVQPDPEIVQRAVLKRLELSRAERGVSAGFDLDGTVSDFLDDRSCRHPDFEDPLGQGGVDNQLALVLPLLDTFGEGALAALLQQSINEGRLLLVFELAELGDGTLELRVRRGADMPLLGTDGLLLSGQTLALHAEPELGKTAARIDGGIVETEPFTMRLPVVVFSTLYQLDLVRARLRFEIGPEGEISGGLLGGGAPLEQVFQVADLAGGQADLDLRGLVGGDLLDLADLDYELASGTCRAVSMAATFEAVPAFLFE